MSKIIKDHLFELIKSLSKSEKRYFKLQISRHIIGDKNNYALLFDYLDKSENYDEKALFKHFKKETFINHFSIAKRRLYDQILSALDAFHAGNSVDAQLYKMMHGTDILYKKSLYSQASKLLNSAYKLVLKHERNTILLEIENKQQQLLEVKHYSVMDKEDLNEIQQRTNDVLNQIRLKSELWFIKSRLFIELNKKGLLRDRQHRDQLEDYHTQVNQLTIHSDLSVSNNYLFHHIEAAYYFAIDDYKNSIIHLSHNLKLLEDNLFLLKEFPNYYIGTLTNAVYVHEQLREYEKADELLKKLKTFPVILGLDLSEDLSLKLFLSTSSIELSLLTSRGEFMQAEKIIPVIESGIKLYGDKIPVQRRLFFAYKFAGIYIGLNDFSEALKWVNRILNTPNPDNNDDIIAYTHILNLILHLELKNNQLIPYTIKNTQRYLKTRNRFYPFEQIILRFISGFNKTGMDFSEQNAWTNLYRELSELQKTEDYQVISEYFDFETWVKSKITNQRFDELIRIKRAEIK